MLQISIIILISMIKKKIKKNVMKRPPKNIHNQGDCENPSLRFPSFCANLKANHDNEKPQIPLNNCNGQKEEENLQGIPLPTY